MADKDKGRMELASILHRLASTQRNLPLYMTEEEHTALREAAYWLEGRRG